MNKSQSRSRRFWTKVKVKGKNDCWPWLAARHVQGYGAFAFSKYKVVTAHRAAWAITYNNGRLPSSKLHVMHQCDNKICVNPLHLKLGTASENEKDAFARLQKVPRRPVLSKYCKRGHRRSHTNTIMKKDGKGKMYPLCKECRLLTNRESRKRNASPEKTLQNTLYMRMYRARKSKTLLQTP